ncbi:MAG: FtsQ-type POTRA domain-containing protein [Rhodothermia bacterium]|nr:FtsQ-type POTRA domain-containing protein [Rhodothermia bacterium]
MQVPKIPRDEEAAASGRRWTYRGIIAAIIFGTLAVIGWQWRSDVAITRIEVRHSCDASWFSSSPGCLAIAADSANIASLVGIEPGGPLYDVDPAVVVDRVVQHPWVESAFVNRTPGGKLIVNVTPREPTLLAVEDGRPTWFIDQHGYRMPFVAGVAYDVPLIYGYDEKLPPNEPTRNAHVRRLAEIADRLDPEIDALISEVEIGSGDDLIVHTTPVGSRPSIKVVVKSDDLENQLVKLRAYWDQVLLADATTNIEQIDLRFDSRIITK